MGTTVRHVAVALEVNRQQIGSRAIMAVSISLNISMPRIHIPSFSSTVTLAAVNLHSFKANRWARGAFLLTVLFMTMPGPGNSVFAEEQTTFRRIQTQYIAALGDPHARSGNGAESWGLWRVDPGPRGVWLGNYDKLQAAGGVAPARWEFDSKEWWVDENGLLMEKPEFPVPPGKYVVTGDREAAGILTIHPAGEGGGRRWELEGATLYDVTHLPCRSAKYTQTSSQDSCSPSKARKSDFPVSPGGIMPAVEGCSKQDYSVLFVIGVAVDN